jgi:hypothetical protein
MSVPFKIDPINGIFRSVKNGDDAVSPSAKSNVTFDAFGNKIHGLNLYGTVNYSQLVAKPNPFPNGGASSTQYMEYVVNFPETLSYAPMVFAQYKNPSGVWVNVYQDSQLSSPNPWIPWSAAGGSIGTAMILPFSNCIKVIWYVINYPNSKGTTPPLAYSYRVFGV